MKIRHRFCGSLVVQAVTVLCSRQCGCVSTEVCPRTATPPSATRSRVRVQCPSSDTSSLHYYHNYSYFYTNIRRGYRAISEQTTAHCSAEVTRGGESGNACRLQL